MTHTVSASGQGFVLSITDVSRSFGGIHAAKDVSLRVSPLETRVVIGPNGAGKSTLFNLITGELAVDKGMVHVFDTDVTHAPIQRRIEVGLGRTYQNSNLFMDMTVRENLFLSALRAPGSGASIPSMLFRPWRQFTAYNERVATIAHRVGVETILDSRCRDLSHGEHRQIELGITLAHDPKLLLLDEPLAGLSVTERDGMRALIESLKSHITMVIIEHDIDTAFALADTVTVLDHGSVVATGTPKEIRNNPTVQEIYTVSNAV